MRRLLLLLALGALVWLVLSRRRAGAPQATVGYEDGSALTLEDGAPGLEPLVRAASGAVAR
ncbi:MAG TPA: hypothetical protein VFR43_06525 [Gaiellaceae bacterium]|nr:hypothetical protein [Gaiellaceae bacterium]